MTRDINTKQRLINVEPLFEKQFKCAEYLYADNNPSSAKKNPSVIIIAHWSFNILNVGRWIDCFCPETIL